MFLAQWTVYMMLIVFPKVSNTSQHSLIHRGHHAWHNLLIRNNFMHTTRGNLGSRILPKETSTCRLLCRVEVKSEQMTLEYWWLYQLSSWCSRACAHTGWSVQCLGIDGCSSVGGLNGQHHHLESDAGCKSQWKSWRRGVKWENLAD